MWQRLGNFVIKFRLPLLIILLGTTALMGFFASKVKLSYDFSRAIPIDNPKYQEYVAFKQKFGEDGNTLVIGIQSDKLYNLQVFNAYKTLHEDLKKINTVEGVLSMPSAITLVKDAVTEKLNPVKIFGDTITTQQQLDSAKNIFFNLPFYQSLLYNPTTHAYLIAVRINKDSINSKARSGIVA
ncbi:MAG: RND transporter, partial [Sphingobacteriales bacterium]|nr:RND transporter [Sphingobacteriales bacterium]